MRFARHCLAPALLTVIAAAQTPGQNQNPSEPAPEINTPQPSASPVPLLRSTSRNVILDIVVTDRLGHPARDLKADDFIVREDKRPQAIHLISSPTDAADLASSSPSALPAAPAVAAAAAPTRNILLLDEMNVNFTDLAYARKRLLVFLQSPPAQHHNFALMALTTTRTVLVHEFTTDTPALADSLKHLPAAMPAAADSSTFVDDERAQDNLIKSIASIEAIAQALSFSPGHISLFWITSGFPTLSPINSSSDVQNAFDQIMQHASNLYLNARMTIYTIDSHGVEWIDSLPSHTQPGAAGSSGSNAFLRGSSGRGNVGDQIAAQQNNLASNRAVANGLLAAMDARTGGRAFSNVNDIDVPLTEALAEGSSIYSVAYSPADKNFNGAFRRISVEVKRPGLFARTREGYYALANPAETNPTVRRAQLASALENPMLFHALDVTGELAEPVGKAPVIRVHVRMPDVEWTYSDRGARVSQTIAVAAYSRSNRPLTSRQWTVAATRPNPAANSDLVYTLPFALPAGTARLRLLVADDAGSRMGTTEVPLTPLPQH